MKKLLHKKIAGFSLVEALIAALVVGLGLLGLAKLQGNLFQGNATSRMQTHALNSAQEKIEDLRDDDFVSINGGNDIVQGANGNFTRTWVVSDCPNAVNCKKVDVAVSWADSTGQAQQINLSSFIGQLLSADSGMPMARAALHTTTTIGGVGGGGETTTTYNHNTTTTIGDGVTTTTLGDVTSTTLGEGTTTTTLGDGTTTTVAGGTSTTAAATTTTAAATTTTAAATTTTAAAPTTTTAAAPTTTSSANVPTTFTMVAPSGCGKNIGQACKFDRGARDGETVKVSFKNSNGQTINSLTVSVTIPTIDIAAGQLQPAIVGGISTSGGMVSFKVRGPGCCESGSWVGLTNKSFTILVTANGVTFTVYMKTDA